MRERVDSLVGLWSGKHLGQHLSFYLCEDSAALY